MDQVNIANNDLQELKEDLLKIKSSENELTNSKWNSSKALSSRSTLNIQDALMERYNHSKTLYMQRRLETIIVDQVSLFDPDTDQFTIPDAIGDEYEIKEKQANAIADLTAAASAVRESLQSMRNKFEAICSRRIELEKMVKDMEDDDDLSDDGKDEVSKNYGKQCSDEDVVVEQEKVDRFQQQKRKMQEDLHLLLKVKEDRLRAITKSRKEFEVLKEKETRIIESGQDSLQFAEKIGELMEIKKFYDSLRIVVENLGGVKIVNTTEENKILFLTLLIHDRHKIRVELELFRTTLLKVVDAKWVSSPLVVDLSTNNESIDEDQFSLPLIPLDDLLHVAKTSMGPPNDLRFIVREACACIRNMQNRVDDLAMLRQQVLTRIVGNSQVICSFNEGIVVDMRLYDQWVEVHQIVGVAGWEKETINNIHEIVSKKDESFTPSFVVHLVGKELKRLKEEDGWKSPKTPVIPYRRKDKLNPK